MPVPVKIPTIPQAPQQIQGTVGGSNATTSSGNNNAAGGNAAAGLFFLGNEAKK
jgi:hypothetical protein